MKLSGQTALVTGVGQGVGRATALELALNGAAVIGVDFDEELLRDTMKEVATLGVQSKGFVCDVADEEQVRNVCAQALAEFGRVDILVNNAGLWRTAWGRFLDTDSGLWKRLIDVNILGTMYFTHALLPKMVENHYGRVINVGSVAGEHGLAHGVPYSMTKGAVSAFTKALAKDMGTSGVTVNSIVPGMIRSTEQDGDMFTDVNAVQRRGLPEECAKLIAFLASDDASYITGQNYAIDGGRFKY